MTGKIENCVDIARGAIDGTQSLGLFAKGLFILAVIMMLFVGVSFLLSSRKRNKTTQFQSKQLHFAAVVLTGLGLIFVLSMGMYYYSPCNAAAKSIFDACKTILPPIITLLLGFYFGQENVKTNTGEENTSSKLEASKLSEEDSDSDETFREGSN